jgi:hypothetical protein
MAKAGDTMSKFAATISISMIRTAVGGVSISNCDDHISISRIAISNSNGTVSKYPKLGPSRQAIAYMGRISPKWHPFALENLMQTGPHDAAEGRVVGW